MRVDDERVGNEGDGTERLRSDGGDRVQHTRDEDIEDGGPSDAEGSDTGPSGEGRDVAEAGIDPAAIGRLAGLASVAVTLGSTLIATVVSPGFSWTGNALSDLGTVEAAVGTPLTVALFNGGLVLGAVLGLGFAWFLVSASESRLGRLAGGSLGLTVASMAGVGLFPVGTTLHVPVAATYFLLITVTIALAAVAGVRGTSRSYGLVCLALIAVFLGVWIGWIAAGGPATVGLAIPEVASSAVFVAWILVTAREWPVG